jgi:DNA-binding YbaB/EbfC family protein
MPGKLDQIKQLWALQKKAKGIQKELKELEIEARSNDGLVSAVFSGEMHIKRIHVDESLLTPGMKNRLETTLQQVVAEGLSKAQAISAEKMKGMMGDMGINLPGMGG